MVTLLPFLLAQDHVVHSAIGKSSGYPQNEDPIVTHKTVIFSAQCYCPYETSTHLIAMVHLVM
jgi:hypothetical protein